MNSRLVKTLLFGLILEGLLFNSGICRAESYEDIAKKVRSYLTANFSYYRGKDLDQYASPKINFVNREELWEIFKTENEGAFKRLEERFGEEEADKIRENYKKELVGLFSPKTKKIYVGDFLEHCKREAILAYELTHYFQDKVLGEVNPNSKGAGDKIFYREMEAGNVEDFLTDECPE